MLGDGRPGLTDEAGRGNDALGAPSVPGTGSSDAGRRGASHAATASATTAAMTNPTMTRISVRA
jgi:hypothetical protein